MNNYLNKMKDVLIKQYKAELKAQEEIEKAKNRYKDDVAVKEELRILNTLEPLRRSAIDDITDIKEAAIKSVNVWASLNGDKISNDVKLLKYDLNNDQFKELVTRHKNNATMCFILAQYGNKRNEQLLTNQETDNLLDVAIVPTVENKIKAYTAFYDSATSLINTMASRSLGQPIISWATEDGVKTFGEPTQLNMDYLKVLE